MWPTWDYTSIERKFLKSRGENKVRVRNINSVLFSFICALPLHFRQYWNPRFSRLSITGVNTHSVRRRSAAGCRYLPSIRSGRQISGRWRGKPFGLRRTPITMRTVRRYLGPDVNVSGEGKKPKRKSPKKKKNPWKPYEKYGW